MGYFMPIEFIYSKGDGKMKRWMAFLLAALLLLAAASAAASDVNKAPKFTGGASWDTAVAITEDQWNTYLSVDTTANAVTYADYGIYFNTPTQIVFF